MSNELRVGDTFKMKFPFRKEKIENQITPLSNNPIEGFSFWFAGCHLDEEFDGSGYGYSRCFTANGEGLVIYEVLSIANMPGRYQDRVIFKRWLMDPDGERYNTGEVRTLTVNSFEKDINSTSPFKAEYEVNE